MKYHGHSLYYLCWQYPEAGDGSDGRHVCTKYHGHTHYYQATILVIGERERANLVVQLARFFGIYPALMYAVMFYVTLNKSKRLGDCVTFSYLSGHCTYRNVSKYALHACHASRGEMSRSG